MHDTGEVDQLNSQVDAIVDELSQPMLACISLSAADLAAWKAFYFSWKTLSIYWTNLRANSGIINSMQGLIDTEGLIGASIYDQMYLYKQQVDPANPNSWPNVLTKACPGTYTPPSVPITLPPSAPPTDWGHIAQMVLTGAIALGTGLVLYKGLTIVEDFTSRAKKA